MVISQGFAKKFPTKFQLILNWTSFAQVGKTLEQRHQVLEGGGIMPQTKFRSSAHPSKPLWFDLGLAESNGVVSTECQSPDFHDRKKIPYTPPFGNLGSSDHSLDLMYSHDQTLNSMSWSWDNKNALCLSRHRSLAEEIRSTPAQKFGRGTLCNLLMSDDFAQLTRLTFRVIWLFIRNLRHRFACRISIWASVEELETKNFPSQFSLCRTSISLRNPEGIWTGQSTDFFSWPSHF